ncbi:MAG TPA: hypothetical protein VNF71_04360 [Acidimicrobiales bacterium]|nr:hypothetical protein [Acidimicrobiales bacterium]
MKLGAAVGTVVILSFPLAAQASTSSSSTAPLAPVATSGVTTATKTVSGGTLTAPLTQALAPKASSQTVQTVTTPAPTGSAEAYAAEVAGIVGISHTNASASSTGTSSSANALELAGKPPAPQFGGSQNGAGTSSNDLLDTGPNSQFRLELTPWSATNTESGGQNNASAIADIVVLDLGDQTTAESASLRLLQSTSNASWNSSASSGNSSSDGAILTLGGPSGLNIDLLHADANSNGTGSSYLLSVNGTEIGSSGQVNGQCTLTIPALLSLDCLTASGGTANGVTSEASGVLSVVLGTPPAGATVGLIQSSTSSGSAGMPSVSSGNGASSSGNSAGGQPSNSGNAAPAAATASSGALAFTGVRVLTLLLAALLLGLLGAFLVWTTRRLRTGAA